jgi:hypothetical protein
MTAGANVNRGALVVLYDAWQYLYGKNQPQSTEDLRYAREVTETQDIETLVGKWLTLPEVAEQLDVIVTRVHNMIKDRYLVDIRLGERKVRYVPAEFLSGQEVLKPLRGTIMVLEDAGFDEAGIIRWLFTEDDSLPGRPIDALHAGRKTEIRRRAQALAW